MKARSTLAKRSQTRVASRVDWCDADCKDELFNFPGLSCLAYGVCLARTLWDQYRTIICSGGRDRLHKDLCWW